MSATSAARPAEVEPNIGLDSVMQRSAGENFTVASRLLPKAVRERLLAVYGYARLIDEIGDRPGRTPEERLAHLDWAESELDRALLGEARHPVFVAIGKTALAVDLDRRALVDLIEANRQDQRCTRYLDYGALEGYCALSANPVGRAVLAVFGATTPTNAEFSDRVCTALQLVEHWQDVVEDHQAGRIYLPEEDLERFSVGAPELEGPVTPALRRLMAYEIGRAREVLLSGAPLVGRMQGFARIAIAGFVGGGLAQIDALIGSGYDVFSAPVKASKLHVARRGFQMLAGMKLR